jgi:maltokinase
MSNGSLTELLAGWLPAQRWFAGGGAIMRDVVIRSDVQLAQGDPELRHLVVDATTDDGTVSYQVLVGLVTQLKPELGPAAIGTVTDGRIAYDGAVDPELTAVLLDGIASERSTGPVSFRIEPGLAIDSGAFGRTLPATASNTSVVFGDEAILKLLRRPSPGHHPDLEIPSRLARSGSRLVAAPRGWIELTASADEPTVLAILAEYFAHSSDGWSLAIADLTAAEPGFSDEARVLGEATAQLHAELAAAFGTSVLSPTALAGMASNMAAELSQAVGVVAELADHERAIMACYSELADFPAEVVVQRIHGDYHLAQVLGTDSASPGGRPPKAPRRWVILDFEGEPSVPLARRRAFAPALRDVAGMLRSFDYVARHQLLHEPDDQRLRIVAADWVGRCQDAFCAGYGEAIGEDPRQSWPLLRALLLQKAVYEAVYEARHRPGWLPIPLHAIAEAVREGER